MESVALRRQYEHAVQARNDLKDSLFDMLQQKSSYSKAADFARHKAEKTAQLIARLVCPVTLSCTGQRVDSVVCVIKCTSSTREITVVTYNLRSVYMHYYFSIM